MEKLRFEDLHVSEELRKAIKDMGFEEATPIQYQAIPYILKGKDIIGQAQTGTGKTAAFGIPTLEMIDPGTRELQAIILCPTRELAIQVAEEMKKLSKYKKAIEILPIYGGQPIERQIKALKKGVQIIIGTPGRVMDHMNRRTLKMDAVRIIILDEADEMLDMGFREDIEFIMEKISRKRQTILFSATMPQAILDLTKKYQNDPQFIKVVHKELTVPYIEQFYFEVKEQAKLETLSRLIDIYNLKLSLVFCNTKRRVDDLVEHLQARGYLADGLHGDMRQSQRNSVMSKFRKGTIEILIATDVAARGIDVEDIEAVFNYDVPHDEEYYVHRIGRTGRAGRKGRSFTFVVGREIYQIKDIQRYAKTKITPQKIPSLGDVEEIKTNLLLGKVKETINEGHLGKYIHWVEGLAGEDYTSIDIAASLLKIIVGEKSKQAPTQEEDFRDTGPATSEMVRLFINAGSKQKVQVKDIVGSIAGETGLSGKIIGAVDIFDNYTFVEVPKEYAEDIQDAMKDIKIKGKKIIIEPASQKTTGTASQKSYGKKGRRRRK
ncbi:MAG: DEAD/DEAH box helicase [Candidatus Jettenia sp.]|uniref:DEAD/DEAH box helicase n=1 Tax=Candidatus Jettenia sp. AMX1 TaxID=2293637 RepID=UPI000688A0E1|nr:MAG: DEAD/DEAH box helicase [Candidatus Jettenia sp. AMX1]MBC6927616.1 DEAD/DEAH box helicase [Candidatus Jettenia sp.]NUN22068.1 DEAD/DEAH box helicase [Candidatus Jettenia caeni]MCE7880195.1 DEAD/DEAH box helicase [Candidatus Jettenia sp. AMX1]MCQ3926635.1 ATP-dependent helicase [Candidatus Jettenia sp.]